MQACVLFMHHPFCSSADAIPIPRSAIFNRNDYQTEDREQVINLLQSTFSCLGFTCQDVGAYHDIIPQCKDNATMVLAGYESRTNVKSKSMVDLDILQVKIFSPVQA